MFLLFLSLGLFVQGQNQFIAQLSSAYDVDNSIVRWYGDNLCVLYTHSASNGNFFHLVNTVTGFARTMEVDHEVYDMEILDDTLYYCGSYLSPYSVLNTFAIQDMFNSSVTIRWFRFPSLYNVKPRRLEVFRASGGVHAVVVGDYTAPSSTCTNTFLADLWRGASYMSTWYGRYFMTDDKECYDDIAVTDNYVVASAHLCQGNDIFVRVFDKPTAVCFGSSCVNNHIFYNCDLSGTCDQTIYLYIGTDHKKPGVHGTYPIRIDHTQGDKVVLACMIEEAGSTGITAKGIDIVSGTPYIVQNTLSFTGNQLGGYYDLRDVRYNSANDSILILVDANTPAGGRSAYVDLDNATFTMNNITYTMAPNAMGFIHSIDWGEKWKNPFDLTLVYQKILSGIPYSTGYMLNIWSSFYSTTNCSESQSLVNKRNDAKFIKDLLPCNHQTMPSGTSLNHTYNVVQSHLDPTCGQMGND